MLETCGTRRAATRPAPGLGQLSFNTGLGCRHSALDCSVETITPELAAKLLTANTSNRPLNETQVAFFESQLKRGEMLLTHQGIAISRHGRLLDGQHRLTAIVRTGIPAQILVAKGLPENVFTVLDTGNKRTASDVLGIDGAANSSILASSIRLYLMYKSCPRVIWTGKTAKEHTTTSAIMDAYNLDRDTWDTCSLIATSNSLNKVCIPSGIACLSYLAVTHGGYTTSFMGRFAVLLKEGSNLQPGHPFLAYRNRMMTLQYGPRGTRLQQSRLADYIKLFNAYVTCQKLKLFKSQAYPPMPTLIHASEAIETEYCEDSGVHP